jgi:hypothetical protein
MSCEPAAEPILNAVTLLAAARCICEALAGISAGANITALTRAFAEIERISELRRTPPQCSAVSESGAAFDAALSSYRSALQAWANELPRIYGLLLAEKHRLETRQEHAAALRTWIDSQQQTR